jgi:hypothetical protein
MKERFRSRLKKIGKHRRNRHKGRRDATAQVTALVSDAWEFISKAAPLVHRFTAERALLHTCTQVE